MTLLQEGSALAQLTGKSLTFSPLQKDAKVMIVIDLSIHCHGMGRTATTSAILYGRQKVIVTSRKITASSRSINVAVLRSMSSQDAYRVRIAPGFLFMGTFPQKLPRKIQRLEEKSVDYGPALVRFNLLIDLMRWLSYLARKSMSF